MPGFGSLRREQELLELVDEGIITPAQADRIREHRSRAHGGPSAFALLASIGGICIALGVILVVAYNWDRFHRGWKLGGFLLALAAVSEAAGRMHGPMLRSAALTGWLLLPLAGIGLMGQVYQLSGDPLKPVLLALALGAPLAIFANHPMVSVIHAGGLAAAAWIGAHDRGTWLTLAGLPELDRTNLHSFLARLAGLALLWTAAGFEAAYRLGPGAKRWLFGAGLCFLWSLATLDTPFEMRDLGAQLLVIGSLIAIFGGGRRLLGLDDETSDRWAAVLTFAVLYGAGFLWHAHDSGMDRTTGPGLVYAGSLAAIGLALTLLARPETPGQTTPESIPGKLLALTPIALGAALMANVDPPWISLAANAAALAFAVREMALGVTQARSRRVTLGILMLGAVLITRFLDYFGTMLDSGVAFIVTGAGFIALAWALHRGRIVLLDRMNTPDRRTP